MSGVDTLERRVAEIVDYARQHGWDVETRRIPGDPHGQQIVAARDRFGFTMALGISNGGRCTTYALDGKYGRSVVVIDDERPDTEWTGSARSWIEALRNPALWTGLEDG